MKWIYYLALRIHKTQAQNYQEKIKNYIIVCSRLDGFDCKVHSSHSCINFGFKLYLLQFFSKFQMLPELHNLSSKLCSKRYNKHFVLHLIVVPQLGGSRQHNYSTRTRQAGRANEKSVYSLMSMALSNMIVQKSQQNCLPNT